MTSAITLRPAKVTGAPAGAFQVDVNFVSAANVVMAAPAIATPTRPQRKARLARSNPIEVDIIMMTFEETAENVRRGRRRHCPSGLNPGIGLSRSVTCDST